MCSVNVAGVSAWKLFLLTQRFDPDVLLLQETWLPSAAEPLQWGDYRVFEQRRARGHRGGIAVLVRKGLSIGRSFGNEYAQVVDITTPNGAAAAIVNVYFPPIENLRRRGVAEGVARQAVEAIANKVPPET